MNHAYLTAASETVKSNAIRAAQADYQTLADDWGSLHAKAKGELEAAMAAGKEPDPDPQVAATLASQGVAAAAEIRVGKLLAEMATFRDRAIRDAEQQHRDRVAASAREFNIHTDATGYSLAKHALKWLDTVAPLPDGAKRVPDEPPPAAKAS